MLDVVERQVLARDTRVHIAPGAGQGYPTLVDALDGFDRVGVGDDLHGERVVEVDPVRILLGTGIGSGIEGLQRVEIGVQLGQVVVVGLQRRVVETVDARWVGREVGRQQDLPRTVIDRGRVRLVAGVPEGDQHGLLVGLRASAKADRRQGECEVLHSVLLGCCALAGRSTSFRIMPRMPMLAPTTPLTVPPTLDWPYRRLCESTGTSTTRIFR